MLIAHNDPRRDVYFTIDPKSNSPVDFGNSVNDPTFPTNYVSYDENTLIWAEAAYRHR